MWLWVCPTTVTSQELCQGFFCSSSNTGFWRRPSLWEPAPVLGASESRSPVVVLLHPFDALLCSSSVPRTCSEQAGLTWRCNNSPAATVKITASEVFLPDTHQNESVFLPPAANLSHSLHAAEEESVGTAAGESWVQAARHQACGAMPVGQGTGSPRAAAGRPEPGLAASWPCTSPAPCQGGGRRSGGGEHRVNQGGACLARECMDGGSKKGEETSCRVWKPCRFNVPLHWKQCRAGACLPVSPLRPICI